MPRINYARADIAKAAKLHKEMDDAWLAAMERDPDSVNRRRWTVSDFVNVCGLYRREAKSGRVVHFGTWGKTRIYMNANDEIGCVLVGSVLVLGAVWLVADALLGMGVAR